MKPIRHRYKFCFTLSYTFSQNGSIPAGSLLVSLCGACAPSSGSPARHQRHRQRHRLAAACVAYRSRAELWHPGAPREGAPVWPARVPYHVIHHHLRACGSSGTSPQRRTEHNWCWIWRALTRWPVGSSSSRRHDKLRAMGWPTFHTHRVSAEKTSYAPSRSRPPSTLLALRGLLSE